MFLSHLNALILMQKSST